MVLDQLPTELVAISGVVVSALSAYFAGKKKGKGLFNLEKELRENLDSYGIFPSPDTTEVSRDFIGDKLEENIPDFDGSAVPVRVKYTDGNYLAPTSVPEMSDAKTFNPFDYLPYRPDIYDCENYASSYKSFAAFLWGTNTMGVVYDWSGSHAYNVIVYANGEVEFYEPQDSKVVELGSDDKYDLSSALIIL